MLKLLTVSIVAAIVGSSHDPAKLKAPTARGPERFYQRCHPLPNGWYRQGCEYGELKVSNLLEVRRDRLFWNGNEISDRTFHRYIAATLRMTPSPAIVLVVDGSSQAKGAEARRFIATSFGCNLEKMCVEYTTSEWKRAHSPAPRNVR